MAAGPPPCAAAVSAPFAAGLQAATRRAIHGHPGGLAVRHRHRRHLGSRPSPHRAPAAPCTPARAPRRGRRGGAVERARPGAEPQRRMASVDPGRLALRSRHPNGRAGAGGLPAGRPADRRLAVQRDHPGPAAAGFRAVRREGRALHRPFLMVRRLGLRYQSAGRGWTGGQRLRQHPGQCLSGVRLASQQHRRQRERGRPALPATASTLAHGRYDFGRRAIRRRRAGPPGAVGHACGPAHRADGDRCDLHPGGGSLSGEHGHGQLPLDPVTALRRTVRDRQRHDLLVHPDQRRSLRATRSSTTRPSARA